MINYKQLYYFWSVAKYGGVTRAAEQLHLTPQTISGQVSELEESLDIALFERIGRRLKLTSAGHLAFSHADEIFQIGKELEALMHGRQDESDLLFKVGVSDVVPKSIAYRLLNPAIQLPEPVKLICLESKLELLFADLAIHKIDLIVSDRPLPTELGIKGFSHFLGESNMAFYAEPQLAKQLRANFPESLNGAPLLIPGMESAMRLLLDRWLTKHKLQPRIKGEFDDTALMKAFGEEGLGVFPGPEVIADEVARQHGVEKIGATSEISCRYYAISVQRKLSHPAVVAISESAQNILFSNKKA
ncbi:MAG: transcriptional activator NhaR [Cellvibrionaceae bacterium]